MRILIIEDDLFFQKFYSQKLREKKLEVDICVNGEEGLTKIRQTRPDLILLDIIMPKMDGFEVLKELKKDPNLNLIPVIIFSTLGQEADIRKGLDLGAKDYINKSFFDFETLYKKIQTYIYLK
ncbi:hypothetical protein A2866_05830 [Candidatus Roizmanbacteria bacterium RIFCSPHIGHO2_01_FULL_39_8]|uniref:Response regulatory domain-containing protein n=3 Tax=Candidatus Roizmaniibacteriota TaxID=1752723 RepID=A0A1F7GSR2_9BACT|nr:MAG: hypothetical protein A2866_05830 [Candidatus Roizmanbacteria bacterium RIFCSPHIGHO2_01_FULL_39_8]OGK27232.1 MAG: hypothetical protein A3C28_04315 [Candidatus Roizmanbacteria bacterium RIFCSPHIGHO2_02_FULL_39_9]OGK35119.1 MAG: hypothetical protein A3F60_02610 [Candidatus Roizmanbacteria bacterium RIFCSPHIGHO2_12_FULL_39_8]